LLAHRRKRKGNSRDRYEKSVLGTGLKATGYGRIFLDLMPGTSRLLFIF
jgi:hypothetical protein